MANLSTGKIDKDLALGAAAKAGKVTPGEAVQPNKQKPTKTRGPAHLQESLHDKSGG